MPTTVGDLRRDLGAALRSGPVRLFLALELAAVAVQVLRRGPGILEELAVLAGGGLVALLAAWLAGRTPWSHDRPDRVLAPRRELAAVVVLVAGVAAAWSGSLPYGQALLLANVGLAAWLAVVLLAGYSPRDLALFWRDPRPLLPLLLMVALPKLLVEGSAYLPHVLGSLESGVSQQFWLLLGITARVEAATRRTDLAVVAGALAFGLMHTPIDMPQAAGDPLVAAANALVFQALVGAVCCLAFTRHRAWLWLGLGHALLAA